MRKSFFANNAASISLRIGVDRNSIALLKLKGRRKPQISVVAESRLTAEESMKPEAMIGHLRRMLTDAACGDHAATIVLADELTRLFMVTPPQNISRLADCRAAAMMRFQELYGEPLGQWQLQADWQARETFLACALPGPLLAGLLQLAKEFRLTLISVQPQFIAAWNQWHDKLDGKHWFAIGHDQEMTLAAIEDKKLRAVHINTVPDGAWRDAQWISEHLQREALRLNLTPPPGLQLCGSLAGPNAPANCIRLENAMGMLPSGSAAVWLARSGAGA